MASPNHVRSRTAINALRGVLLTTSCSVILLAEERRQRLKIARAAYENARKLHTARVDRGSVALSESFGRRETYPAELGDLSTTAKNPNPIRRRRRNGELSSKSSAPRAAKPSPSTPGTESQAFLSPDSPEARQKSWDEWDTARKELSRLSPLSPFAHNDLFLRISTDEIPNALRRMQQARKDEDASLRNQSDLSLATQASDLPRKLNPTSHETPLVAQEVQHTSTLSDNPRRSALLKAAFVGDDLEGATDSFDQESIADSTTTLVESVAQQEETESQVPLIQLDRLVAELESPKMDQATIPEQQESAIHLLKSLISSKSVEPRLAMARGLRVLESVVRTEEHGKLPAILDALHPICNEVCLLAVPAMDNLYEKRDIEGTRQLLQHLSNSEVWKSEETPFNLRNPWITRTLMHYWRKTQNFGSIKGIYGLLQDAGLFDDGFLSTITQYSIRRRVALIALDAGDDATARAEMQTLRSLRPQAAEHDVKLRGRFAIRDASLGNWESVWPQLQIIKIKSKGKGEYYQNTLSWLTKLYCKDHSPEAIDTFVRDLVTDYDMALNETLAFLVIDKHGRNRDIQALVQWLQFCHDSGLELNQIFFNEIVEKCCKYWNLARADVLHMLRGVRSCIPSMHDPHVAKYSVQGGLNELHQPLPGEKLEDSKSQYVSKLPETSGDSVVVFERIAFRCMNTWAQKKDWKQVCSAFKEALGQGIGFSSRCLRLAVIANLNMEGPHSRTATELVSEAHAEGHDVSGALVPLLVTRLESGDNVGAVLQAALSQGERVHDSVYNKAARILTQKGLNEGAIRVCELAAQQNGNGELAYSQFNFANLVFAYTGQQQYTALEALIRSFNAKSEWWLGSKECKESLKRAMKAVAARAVRGPAAEKEVHEQVLAHLGEALEHIKTLRATVREDRATLTTGIINVFKGAEDAHDLHVDSVEKENSQILEARMTWEAPTTKARDWDQADQNKHTIVGNVKADSLQKPGREKARAEESHGERDDIFMARQNLAGAFF